MSTARVIRNPQLVVRSLNATCTEGLLFAGSLVLKCALGRAGTIAVKREGDGATPRGRWRVARVFYRPDRILRPLTSLALTPLRRDDGWCDAPADRNYNRPVRLPYRGRCERLWRDDHLYDLVCVLDHNTRPRVRGGGSAIFLHIAAADHAPTEGCIAVSRGDLLKLLAVMRRGSALIVRP